MVIDQNYINRTNDLYAEAMAYGGNILADFYAGKDHATQAIKNKLITCRNLGTAIKDYEYSLGEISDAIIESIHNILLAIRDFFKRLCNLQDDFIDSPFIDEYIINDSLSQALVRTAEMDNLTDTSGAVNPITITAVSGNNITVDELPAEAVKENVNWYLLSCAAADNSVADPDETEMTYDVYTSVISIDFANKIILVDNATGFTVGDPIALHTLFTNLLPVAGQETHGIMGYEDLSAMTGGSFPDWAETARDIYAGPTWKDPNTGIYHMVYTVDTWTDGTITTSKFMGVASSTDLINWTYNDDELIGTLDDPFMGNFGMGMGKGVLVGSTFYFMMYGQDSGMSSQCKVCSCNVDGTGIDVMTGSVFSITGAQCLTADIEFFNNEFHVITSELVGANIVGKHYSSPDARSGYSAISDVYTTALDTNDSHFMERFAGDYILFQEPVFDKETGKYSNNSELFAFYVGKGQYNASGFKGQTVMGLLKFDPTGPSWAPVNNYAPEIIFPYRKLALSYDGVLDWAYTFATGHSMIKDNGNAYLITTLKRSGVVSGTGIALLKFIDNH